jgi:hypothetical protein
MKARMGAPKAMTATAHKLARIVYYWSQRNRNTMQPSFNSKSNADGCKNQLGSKPRQENSDSTSSPSILFLERTGGLPMEQFHGAVRETPTTLSS